MNRRDFLRSTMGAASACVLPFGRREKERVLPMAPTPNVLFLFADDQRFDTLRGLGNEQIITPHLDSLVHRGVSFTQAHIMGGSCPAVCVPSRAMTLTGRSLFRITEEIAPDHTTLPQAFATQGYRTFITGKWHNGRASLARSFQDGQDIFFGGMGDHRKVPVFDFDPSGRYPQEKMRVGEKFSSELFTDAAIRFLQRERGDAPFFLYVAYTAPHDPRMAPPEYADLYDPAQMVLPPNFMPQHPFDNGEMQIRDELLAPFPRTEEVIRQHIADYYAMISHLDAQIGRVLSTLRETGQDENTIIVFAGDNGLAVGQHGLMGKQNLYEHSVHVPLIMSGPGIPADERRKGLCYLLDVFPTLCDLTGTPIPATVEGKSLTPLIRGEERRMRDTLFFAYRDVQRGVRDEQYKLIEYQVKGQRTTQLFDLKKDPWEMENLANHPRDTDLLAKMRRVLADTQNDLEDPAWRLSSWSNKKAPVGRPGLSVSHGLSSERR